MNRINDIVNHKIIFDKRFEVDLRQTIWPCSALSLFYLMFFKKSGFEDSQSFTKLSSQSEDEYNEDDEPYTVKDVKIPEVKGWFISLYRKILRSPFGRYVLTPSAIRQGELDMFLKLIIPDKPTYYPIVLPNEEVTNIAEESDIILENLIKSWCLEAANDQFHFNSISDYYTAYRDGRITPLGIAKKVIAAIKDSEKENGKHPRMRMIIDFQEEKITQRANESTERWSRKQPLSVFDGVPVAVKDEIFLAGYPCRAGLPIEELGMKKTLEEEGWMVRRLREGGAIFIGMANMHQLGIGVTGINASKYHGTCRNPVNPDYPPGGSSSGPAASVASGLCPVALGADGGGSIRLPSGICGIVGAKASFSRISGTGLHANCDTVSHPGALCATVRDAAITYGFLAGKDPEFSLGHVQPKPTLSGFEDKNLEGLKIGIDWIYFKDCDREIYEACEKCVKFLSETCKATIVDISIPEIQEASRAHVITTLTEMYTYSQNVYHEHHDEINTETEVNLGLGSTFKSEEYFKAQKQRTRNINILKRLFKTVDCIITPAFGTFMPKLNADILKYGFMNLKHLTDVVRFAVLGNLTGHPAISVPVGYANDTGLPIAIQIQTPWWREDLMFRIAHAAEDHMDLRKPKLYYDHFKEGSFENMSIASEGEST